MKRLIAAILLTAFVVFAGTYLAVGSGLLPWLDNKPLLTSEEAVAVVLAHLNNQLPHIVESGDWTYNITSFRRSDVDASARYEEKKWMVNIFGASPGLKKEAEEARQKDIRSPTVKIYYLNTGTYIVDDKTGKVTGP